MPQFLMLLLMLLSGCQFGSKEASSGALVADHEETTNSFTVIAPSSASYTDTQVLTFKLKFPFNVAVDTTGGTPRLSLTVGSTTRYANYVSGDGSKELLFSYTVVAADEDADGVRLNSLGLNGGTLKFTSNGTTANCDISTVKAKTYSGVKVDNTVAEVESLVITNAAGFYRLGEVLNFTVTFSEKVVVDTIGGTPSFTLGGFANGSGVASYISGSGTKTLTFRYTIQNTAQDINGYTAGASISLNSGTIKDLAGIDADLTLIALAGSAANGNSVANVDFSGRVPYVTLVTLPSNGTYAAAQNLDFQLEFNQPVNVNVAGGTPRLDIVIGSTTRYATYQSGGGTNTLLFRYTTAPGDVDTNGITVPTSLTMNGGIITSTVAPAGVSYVDVTTNNSFTVPSATGIKVSAPQPQISSVSISTDTTNASNTGAIDNVWNIGQVLQIAVGFNDNVYVNQTSGTPRIAITLGSGTVYANYYSGGDGQTNLFFRYTIQEGDEDTNGIDLAASIDLNGGTITNQANTNAIVNLTTTNFATTRVDGIRPILNSVTAPPNTTYSNVVSRNNTTFLFTTSWSEAVNFTGALSITATLNTGGPVTIGTVASGNNSATVVLRPAAFTASWLDTDGIVLSTSIAGAGVVSDLAGNTPVDRNFVAPDTSNIFLDTTAPNLSSVTAPANDTYVENENIDFTLNFTENVDVNTAGGTPRLQLNVGGTTRYANYTSGSGTAALVFRYVVQAGDVDTNGIALVGGPPIPVALNGGTILDAGLNPDGTLSFAAPNLTAVRVDAQSPSISSVTGPANGTYFSGDTLSLTVNFSEAVTLDDSGGTPTIAVTAGSGALSFECAPIVAATSTTCSYQVQAGDYDYDGLTSATSIVSNGGTIEDASANSATLTFSAPNLTQVRIAHDGLIMWGQVNDTNNRNTTGAVLNSLTDKSGNGNTMTTAGSPNYSGNYVQYDGVNDAMNFAGTLTNTQHLLLAVRTPTLPFTTATQDIFGDGAALLQFVDGGADVDLNLGALASYSVDCAGLAGPTSGPIDETITGGGSMIIFRLSLSGAQTLMGGFIGATGFEGRVAEIMVFDSSAAGGDINTVCTYLNGKY